MKDKKKSIINWELYHELIKKIKGERPIDTEYKFKKNKK